MSFINDNLDNVKKGFEGEQIVRDLFKKQKIKFMQVDIMWKNKAGQWCLGEVKTQDKFEAPPFDGHGLPEWQIKTRLDFQKDTGVIAYFFVVDKKDGFLYWQRLDELMKTDYFKTNDKQRVIFKLDSYTRRDL